MEDHEMPKTIDEILAAKAAESKDVPAEKQPQEPALPYDDMVNDDINYMHQLGDELKQWKNDLEHQLGEFSSIKFNYMEELRKLALEQRALSKKNNADKNSSLKSCLKNDHLKRKVNIMSDYLVSTLDWEEFKTNEGLKPKSMVNIIYALKTDPELVGRFRFNEFTHSAETTEVVNTSRLHLDAKPLDDDQLDSIVIYLNFRNGVLFDRDLVDKGIKSVAREYPYHPIKDRIERAKWDGIKRLDTVFIDYLGAEDTDLNRLITRTWFCGLIARIYKPGIKFELMPILSGPQGIGKSSLIKAILPEYYKNGLPKMDSSDRNTVISLKDNAIIEIAELSAFKASQIEAVKDFLSTEVDKSRLMYGKNDAIIPRSVVFIGTTNQDNYLKDKSGNRRFPTIKCGVQEAKLSPWHVDDYEMQQVLAEAKVAWEGDQKIYLDDETEDEIAEIQEDAMIIDEKEIAIKKFIDMTVPDDWENYNLYEKQNYFTRWNDNGDLWPRFIDNDNANNANNSNNEINASRKDEIAEFNPTNKITAFTVNDVLKIVFKRDSSNTKKDGLPSSIKAILDNMLKPAPKRTGAKWSYPNSDFKSQGDAKPVKQRHYQFNG